MRKLNLVVMALVGMLLSLMVSGCGSDSAQLNSDVPQVVPIVTPAVAKTEGVNMKFDLRATKQTAKTVYGGGVVSTILQSYKDEVTQVSVHVRTPDYVEVADFENLPVVNGVFNTIREDGSSMINLPVGEYIIWADCNNAAGTTRFSGITALYVVAGGPNDCIIDMVLENIYVDLAITNAPGNFDKSDGQYDTGMRYSGLSDTDDHRWFRSDQIAYADLNGILHVIIVVNPLTTNKVSISVTDKDGMTIVQSIDLDMSVAIAAERNNQSYWYTYQKTDAVNIHFNFPE